MLSHKNVPGVAWLLPLLFTSLVHAQIRSATITGTVKDVTGAVVAGAEVSILNQETNIATSMKSTDAGLFVFPYLPAGLYTVSISAPGF